MSHTSTTKERPAAASGDAPSMEEILLSIRNVIAGITEHRPETQAAARVAQPASADADDVLELTEIADDHAVNQATRTSVSPQPSLPEASFAPAMEASASPVFFPEGEPPPPLLSEDTALKTAGSLNHLMHAIDQQQSINSEPSTQPISGRTTLEELVTETLKPSLIEWMDQNLPALVERIVEREIQTIIEKHVTKAI